MWKYCLRQSYHKCLKKNKPPGDKKAQRVLRITAIRSIASVVAGALRVRVALALTAEPVPGTLARAAAAALPVASCASAGQCDSAHFVVARYFDASAGAGQYRAARELRRDGYGYFLAVGRVAFCLRDRAAYVRSVPGARCICRGYDSTYRQSVGASAVYGEMRTHDPGIPMRVPASTTHRRRNELV
jgi:hypothetical protein